MGLQEVAEALGDHLLTMRYRVDLSVIDVMFGDQAGNDCHLLESSAVEVEDRWAVPPFFLGAYVHSCKLLYRSVKTCGKAMDEDQK